MRASDMRTTVDIAEPLLEQAREFAMQEGMSLSALVEKALSALLEVQKPKEPFRLQLVTVGGRGLRPELKNASWNEIRDLAYGDRGGLLRSKPRRRS